MHEQRPHVVVVGGGFGGLNVARQLAKAAVDVTVIDRTNHHLFQPLLYQVAAGILPPGLIAPPIRGVLRKQANTRVVLAEVYDIDLDERVVRSTQPDGEPFDVPYDVLVLAGGATHAYFGHDEFAPYAPGMKTIEDARYLRDGILSKFEMAELATDPDEVAAWLTFVVVGAGPTGVELVGQIAELAHVVLPRDYRNVDTRGARILLVEGADAVLPPFAPKLRAYTHKRLRKMGVEIMLETLAVGMDHDSVTIRGPQGEQTIRARTRIWAAGVQASALAALLAAKTGAQVDRAGRIAVNPDCTLPGHPEVFAIGDMVSLNKLPGVAQPAIQEGKYVGKVIKARLHGQQVRAFAYRDKGSMATIGYNAAVADAFGLKLTGRLAYLLWAGVHVMYLIGWGNRLGTMYTWGRAMISRNRAHRIITFERAHERLEGRPPAVAPASVDLRQPGDVAADTPQRPGGAR